MTSVRPKGDDAWNYLRILPQVKQYLLMDEIAPGIFECVALDGLKSKSTVNSDDPPNSFRTRDLFMQHPSNPDFWKYVSRLDDRLTLVNGEKVLPIPIEGRIRQETSVQEAIVFGDGKLVPGILIIRADSAADMTDAEFLQHIWPSVEDANSRAESFSQIPQDLVVVLPPRTKYPSTDKSTFIRAQVYEQFKRQISDAYERFENDTGGSLALPLLELEAHLLRRFREHLDVDLASTESDFFAFGIDSLQCLKMWSLIKKEIDLGGKQSEVGQNVLYETGNISSLARYLDGLRNGTQEDAQDQEKVMTDLIAKYFSTSTSTQPNSSSVSSTWPTPSKQVVVRKNLYIPESQKLTLIATDRRHRRSRCTSPLPAPRLPSHLRDLVSRPRIHRRRRPRTSPPKLFLPHPLPHTVPDPKDHRPPLRPQQSRLRSRRHRPRNPALKTDPSNPLRLARKLQHLSPLLRPAHRRSPQPHRLLPIHPAPRRILLLLLRLLSRPHAPPRHRPRTRRKEHLPRAKHRLRALEIRRRSHHPSRRPQRRPRPRPPHRPAHR